MPGSKQRSGFHNDVKPYRFYRSTVLPLGYVYASYTNGGLINNYANTILNVQNNLREIGRMKMSLVMRL